MSETTADLETPTDAGTTVEPKTGNGRTRGRAPKANGAKPKRTRRTKEQMAAARAAAGAAEAGKKAQRTASIGTVWSPEPPMAIVRTEMTDRLAVQVGGELAVQVTAVAALNALSPTERLRTALWLQHYCAEIVAKHA